MLCLNQMYINVGMLTNPNRGGSHGGSCDAMNDDGSHHGSDNETGRGGDNLGNEHEDANVDAQAQESEHSIQFKSMQCAMNRLAKFANSDRMNDVTYEALQVRNERQMDVWQTANTAFEKLLKQADKNTGVNISYEDIMGQLKDTYFDISEKFRSKMNELERARMDSLARSNSSSEAGASDSNRPIKVILPSQQQSIMNTWGTFDGNEKAWPAFCDLFTIAIHNNKDVEDGYK